MSKANFKIFHNSFQNHYIETYKMFYIERDIMHLAGKDENSKDLLHISS